MNRSDDALSTLDEVEGKMAEDDLDLVPVLHARADVLDSSGKPLALVAAQFARARDVCISRFSYVPVCCGPVTLVRKAYSKRRRSRLCGRNR